jgi:hypothetical protein
VAGAAGALAIPPLGRYARGPGRGCSPCTRLPVTPPPPPSDKITADKRHSLYILNKNDPLCVPLTGPARVTMNRGYGVVYVHSVRLGVNEPSISLSQRLHPWRLCGRLGSARGLTRPAEGQRQQRRCGGGRRRRRRRVGHEPRVRQRGGSGEAAARVALHARRDERDARGGERSQRGRVDVQRVVHDGAQNQLLLRAAVCARRRCEQVRGVLSSASGAKAPGGFPSLATRSLSQPAPRTRGNDARQCGCRKPSRGCDSQRATLSKSWERVTSPKDESDPLNSAFLDGGVLHRTHALRLLPCD